MLSKFVSSMAGMTPVSPVAERSPVLGATPSTYVQRLPIGQRFPFPELASIGGAAYV